MTKITKSNDIKQPMRPKRVPLHKQRILSALTREGYVRRWVNDVPGRLDMFIAAGWTFVRGEDNNNSDVLAQTESQMGSNIRKRTNLDDKAKSQYSYLMEIPKEWYDEVQQDKMKECDKNEAELDPEFHARKMGMDYGFMRRETKK